MENSKRLLIINIGAAALFLSGCVSDNTELGFEAGRHSNYRALLVEVSDLAIFPTGTPQSVKDRYRQCAADFILTGISPTDLPKLDAYAQGRRDMAIGELRRINEDIEAKLGPSLTKGGLERLSGVCPDDVADFQKYPPR